MVGEAHVEHDRVEPARAGARFRRGRIGHRFDLEQFLPQAPLEEATGSGFVFDNQHAHTSSDRKR